MKKIVIVLLLSISYTITIYANRLVFYTDLIRHGARTTLYPLKGIIYPPLWSSDNVPVGQLTAYGFQEAILFGQGVRVQCTSANCNFLSSSYNARRVCVRTTGINRTIMTAEAALTGIYPTLSQALNTNAFIRLDSFPQAKDNLLLQSDNYNTPALNHATQWQRRWQSAMGYTLYQQLQKVHSNFFPNGICALKSKTKDYKRCLSDIIPLADNVQMLQDYCQAGNQCSVQQILHLSRDEQNKVMNASAWYAIHAHLPTHAFNRYRTDYQTRGMAKGSRVVSEIAHNMHFVIKNPKQKFPYVLYSAHDSSLFGALSYLLAMRTNGVADHIMNQYPGFVADLRFLLYQTAQKKFIVKVIYYQNANLVRLNKGIVVLQEPFEKFYKTYYLANKYKTINSQASCDYIYFRV